MHGQRVASSYTTAAPALATLCLSTVNRRHTMTDKQTQQHADEGNMQKDPDHWVTGDEPMTGAQMSYLKTLCEEAKEDFDEKLTKAEASKRIDELRARTGRGQHAH